MGLDYKKTDRLTEIWSAAREIYSGNPFNLSALDSWVDSFEDGEKDLALRIGLILQAKKVYDIDCGHSLSPFKFWAISRQGSEREAARLIYDYVIEQNQKPSTQLWELHTLAQERLFNKISEVYP